MILYWQDNERYAHVYKSPYLPPATAHYLVTADGVRGRKPAGVAAGQRAGRGQAAGQGASKRSFPEGGFA